MQVMLLGRLIRAWRERQRLGLRAVAKEIGIAPATLGRLETGENVDGDTLTKVLAWSFGNSELEIGP